MLKIGILGLPNVGKSTLFQALTCKQVDISNYPFCTLEPNVGLVEVPDQRLLKLSKVSGAKETVGSVIKFVDVAGLVQGAAEGQGLGNQFLAHLRETDALLHVVRVFQRQDVAHIEGTADPKRDIEIVQQELREKDLETIERREKKIAKDIKQGNKEAINEGQVLARFKKQLQERREGCQTSLAGSKESNLDAIRHLFLLTTKPQIYVLNGSDKEVPLGIEGLVLDLRDELDKTELTPKERQELGLGEPGLSALIKRCYSVLNLLTFFTVQGKKQTRAWPLEKGKTAFEAAGLVHSDFQENFIKAEVVSWQDLVMAGSWQAARSKGMLQTKGKDYIMQEGDVIEFK